MIRQLTEKNFAGHNKGGGGFLCAFSLSHLAKCFRDHQFVVLEMKAKSEKAYSSAEILKLFRTGVRLLNEVHLLLHPLKCVLKWPME